MKINLYIDSCSHIKICLDEINHCTFHTQKPHLIPTQEAIIMHHQVINSWESGNHGLQGYPSLFSGGLFCMRKLKKRRTCDFDFWGFHCLTFLNEAGILEVQLVETLVGHTGVLSIPFIWSRRCRERQ